MRKLAIGNVVGLRLYVTLSNHKSRKSWARNVALLVIMINISAIEAVEISEIEHSVGELRVQTSTLQRLHSTQMGS